MSHRPTLPSPPLSDQSEFVLRYRPDLRTAVRRSHPLGVRCPGLHREKTRHFQVLGILWRAAEARCQTAIRVARHLSRSWLEALLSREAPGRRPGKLRTPNNPDRRVL